MSTPYAYDDAELARRAAHKYARAGRDREALVVTELAPLYRVLNWLLGKNWPRKVTS